MLTWDRVDYEGQRRQDERVFAARQRLIRQAQRRAPRQVKAYRRWLARLGARLTSRGDCGDSVSAVIASPGG